MDFETIEDRIIEALKTAMPYLKTVGTYGGQFAEADMDRMALRFPSAHVVYGGSQYNALDGPNHEELIEFTVFVMAKNLRGSREQRKGGPDTERGAYELIKDTLHALTNNDLDLPMERLRPVRTLPVELGKTASVYAIEFRAAMDAAYERD